jgi:hypothetical protein
MPIDYLNDENGDLAIANGDLVKGDATKKHQFDLLMTEPGHLREFPTRGVGVGTFINNENPTELARAIRKEFTRDGMRVNNIQIDENGELIIEAPYSE